MDWELFQVVRFEIGPLLQSQTSISKLKSAYVNNKILLIIGSGWVGSKFAI